MLFRSIRRETVVEEDVAIVGGCGLRQTRHLREKRNQRDKDPCLKCQRPEWFECHPVDLLIAQNPPRIWPGLLVIRQSNCEILLTEAIGSVTNSPVAQTIVPRNCKLIQSLLKRLILPKAPKSQGKHK